MAACDLTAVVTLISTCCLECNEDGTCAVALGSGTVNGSFSVTGVGLPCEDILLKINGLDPPVDVNDGEEVCPTLVIDPTAVYPCNSCDSTVTGCDTGCPVPLYVYDRVRQRMLLNHRAVNLVTKRKKMRSQRIAAIRARRAKLS